MSTLSNKILDKINEEHITPTPRSKFQLLEYGKWLFLFLFLCGVILSVSVILHILVNNDWDFSNLFGGSILSYTLTTLPYIWLVFSVLFLFITFYEFRNTKNGYKFENSKVITVCLFIALIIGGGLFYIGIGKKIHKTAAQSLPMYESVVPLREKRWIEAEKGFLGGEVITVSDETFNLKDPKGNEWIVETTELPFKDKAFIKVGSKIRMYGSKTGDKTFLVKIVKDWNETRSSQEVPVQQEFRIYIIESREI